MRQEIDCTAYRDSTQSRHPDATRKTLDEENQTQQKPTQKKTKQNENY